jgi:glycosyltransferase involved in cell wall biosynthesis
MVEPGRTGFLVHDAPEMAEAIDAAGELHPQTCREAARSRFSLQRTISHYLDVYRWMAGQ